MSIDLGTGTVTFGEARRGHHAECWVGGRGGGRGGWSVSQRFRADQARRSSRPDPSTQDSLPPSTTATRSRWRSTQSPFADAAHSPRLNRPFPRFAHNPCRRQGDQVVAPGSTGRRLLVEDDLAPPAGADRAARIAWRRASALVVLSQGAHARMDVPVGEGSAPPRSGRSRDVRPGAGLRSLSPAVAVVGTRPDRALACRPIRSRLARPRDTLASTGKCASPTLGSEQLEWAQACAGRRADGVLAAELGAVAARRCAGSLAAANRRASPRAGDPTTVCFVVASPTRVPSRLGTCPGDRRF